MSASSPNLVVNVRGPVAELRLNRPDVRNAVNDDLRSELLNTLGDMARSDEVHVVILTGEGTAFCSGGDIRGMRERLRTPAGKVAGQGWRRLKPSQRLILDLHELDKVTIAAVNGPAAGYGMDLALACDFVIAAESAFFAMSYVQRGLVPDGGGSFFLPRRVGLARAKELIFTGRRVQAAEALAIGLADRVVPASELDAAAGAWADEFAAQPALATSLAKSILNQSLDLSAAEVLALSAAATAICYTTDEHLNLVESFGGKHPKG